MLFEIGFIKLRPRAIHYSCQFEPIREIRVNSFMSIRINS